MQLKFEIDRFIRHGGRAALMFSVLAAVSGQTGAFLRPAPNIPPPAEVPAQEPTPEPARTPDSRPDGFDVFYDRSNPDLVHLQAAGEALQPLPKDRDGRVDWMNALRSGAIAPHGKLDGSTGDPPLDLDIIMRNTRLMPYVRFSHRAHTEWLACKNCHPAIFPEKAGITPIKMENIFRGQFCGTCHDRVAFVTHRNCFRCHSVPQE